MLRSQSAKAGANRHLVSIRSRRQNNEFSAMKVLNNPSVQTLQKMLYAEKNPMPQPDVGQVTQGDDDKNKTQRVRIHYYELNQDQREQYFRIKSAKKEKKLTDAVKKKEEIHEWNIQQRTEKLKHALQNKKMQDMQEEAKRQKKYDQYQKKTEEIKKRLETLRNNYTGHGSQMDSENNGGMSGMDEYESGANYQSAMQDQEEYEIQEKLRHNEEKMQRALFNKLKKLEEQRANL